VTQEWLVLGNKVGCFLPPGGQSDRPAASLISLPSLLKLAKYLVKALAGGHKHGRNANVIGKGQAGGP